MNDVKDSKLLHFQESDWESSSRKHDLEVPIALRKGTRSCTNHPISRFIDYGHLSKQMKTFVANLSAVEVPKTENEAMTKPEWKAAHMEEIHALEKHGIWEVVEKPKHTATIGC